MDRRDLLKVGASGAVSLAAIQTRAFAAGNDQPIRVALIGSGWYGKTDLFHLIQVAPVEVVGLCDVDSQMVVEAAELVSQRQPSKKKPPTFGDYRELLAKQKPEVVLIGTPDHWHCLPMVEACKAGADVYVQKPISWDVVEGQAMVAAARKYNRTVQVGLQRRSTPHLLEARDKFIRSGKLGKIAYVDIHSYFGGQRNVCGPPKPRRKISIGRCMSGRRLGVTTCLGFIPDGGDRSENSATDRPAIYASTSSMWSVISSTSAGQNRFRPAAGS